MGGSHISTNPLSCVLKDKVLCDKINKVLLPMVFKEVERLLTPKKLLKEVE
jgi:hypothetical protein